MTTNKSGADLGAHILLYDSQEASVQARVLRVRPHVTFEVVPKAYRPRVWIRTLPKLKTL